MNIIENVIVGNPTLNPATVFAYDTEDWELIEKPKTLFTAERYLPKIMKDVGIVNSISEVRRNQPGLCITLEQEEFRTIKWGKKFLFILVGEETDGNH